MPNVIQHVVSVEYKRQTFDCFAIHSFEQAGSVIGFFDSIHGMSGTYSNP